MGRLSLKLGFTMAVTAILAWVGMATGRGAGHVPAIWWANAALVAIVLLNRRQIWLPLLAAGLAGTILGHVILRDSVLEAVCLSFCDVAETVIAVYGVGLALGQSVDLTKQRQLLLFVLFAVLLGPLVSSNAAGFALHLLEHGTLAVSLRWFPASALGMIVVVPLVLGLARPETRELLSHGRLAGTLLYLTCIAAGTVAIFSSREFPWLFFMFPPLLFLVVRLGLSGGVLGCCVVASIGTYFTVDRAAGPLTLLSDSSLEHRILILQLFVATAVLSVSIVAVVFADLRRATLAASHSEERYRELASSMETLAGEDALTGVANRRQFDMALLREWHRAIRTGQFVALLLLDVDHFKTYNDLYGHLEGDRCLCRVTAAASAVARRPSDTVARFGGDEFAVILPDTPAPAVLSLAEKIRLAVMQKGIAHAGNPPTLVTVCIGCATFLPKVGESPTLMLAAADKALYAAKKAGRNRVESSESLQNQPR